MSIREQIENGATYGALAFCVVLVLGWLFLVILPRL